MFKSFYHSTLDIYKTNFHNTNSISFKPTVDEIYIFPSKSQHSTSKNKTKEERMSISADISVVSKKSENIEFLQTPINKWKKF